MASRLSYGSRTRTGCYYPGPGLPAVMVLALWNDWGNSSLSDIPIIVLTAREISGNREKALNAGAQAFLQKPVENEVLLETIRNLLAINGKSGTGNRINGKKGMQK